MRERRLGRVLIVLALLLSAPAVTAEHEGVPHVPPEDPRPKPDVGIHALTVEPTRPVEGERLTLCAFFYNYGEAAPEPFTAVVRFDGRDVAVERFTRFPEDGATLCGEARAPAGSYALEALADAREELDEETEENNHRSRRVVVRERPVADLHVEVHLTPDPPERGRNVLVVGHVLNAGSGPAGNFSVDLYRNDTRIARHEVPAGLPPGAVYRVGTPVWADTLPEGASTFRVVADPGAIVNEVNLDNNVAERVVDMPRLPLPRVIVANLTAPADATEGDALRFTADVENRGDKGSGPVDVRFIIGADTVARRTRLDELAPGEAERVDATWTARRAGTFNVTVEVTLRNMDDANATYVRNATFTVAPLDQKPMRPDLVAERLIVSPPHPEPGLPVNFTAVIRNAGPVASGAFTVAFHVNGDLTETFRAGSLPPDGYLAATAAWDGIEGVHEITVTLDPDGDIADANRTDNVQRARFTVLAPRADAGDGVDEEDAAPDGNETAEPDEDEPVRRDAGDATVALDVMEVGHLDEVQGEPDARLYARIANRGNAVAPAFTVHFYLDGEHVGSREQPGLSPGRDVILSWGAHMDANWTAPEPGRHTMRAVAIVDGESGPGPLADREETFTITEDARGIPAPSALLALAVALAAARAGARHRRRAS